MLREYTLLNGAPALVVDGGADALTASLGVRPRMAQGAGGAGGASWPPTYSQTVTDRAALVALDAPVNTVVRVTDDGDGRTSYWTRTNSGKASDGGTVLVPAASRDATLKTKTGVQKMTAVTLSATRQLVWEDTVVTVSPGKTVPAPMLHGAAGDNPGKPYLDTGAGTFFGSNGLSLESVADGDGDRVIVQYREVLDNARWERVVQPWTFKDPRCVGGVRSVVDVTTTDYVDPRWWGAVPYPDDYVPDTSNPGGATPTGPWTRGGANDSADAVNWACRTARAKAVANGREWRVMFDGLYGIGGPIAHPGKVVLAGANGTWTGDGVRYMKNSLWHALATGSGTTVDANYRQTRDLKDRLCLNSNTSMLVMADRTVTATDWARTSFFEVDGGTLEEAYIITREYTDAAGGDATGVNVTPAPSGFSNWVQNRFRNTSQGTAYSVTYSSPNDFALADARVVLHGTFHSTASSVIMSNSPVNFAGSDVVVRDGWYNHTWYGVNSDSSEPMRVRSSGYYIGHAVIAHNGWFDEVSVVCDSGNSPALNATPRQAPLYVRFNAGAWNDGAGIGNGGLHHFGKSVTVDKLVLDFRPVGTNGATYPANDWMHGQAAGDLTIGDVQFLGSPPSNKRASYSTSWSANNDNPSSCDITFLDPEGNTLPPTSLWLHYRTQTVRLRGLRMTGAYQNALQIRAGGSLRGSWLLKDIDLVDLETDPIGQFLNFWPLSDASLGADVWVDGGRLGGTTMVRNETGGGLTLTASQIRDLHPIRSRNATLKQFWDTGVPAAHTYSNCVILDRGGRTTDATTTLSGAALASGAVDWNPGLANEPKDPSFVTVTGADAARFTGWTNVGTSEDPVLRLAFSGTDPVSVTVTASVRPIDPGDVFPE